jgi:flavin-dependent dehydrogenase
MPDLLVAGGGVAGMAAAARAAACGARVLVVEKGERLGRRTCSPPAGEIRRCSAVRELVLDGVGAVRGGGNR